MTFIKSKSHSTRTNEYGLVFLKWNKPHRCWSLSFMFGQTVLIFGGGVYPNAGT